MEERFIVGAKKSLNIAVTFTVFALLGYLSYLYSVQVAQHRNEELHGLFQNSARQLSDLLREKVKPFPLLLRTSRGVIPDGQEMKPEQWSHFVNSLDLDYQDFGIIGLTFTESVSDGNKAQYIRSKQQLFPGFRVFPEGQRNEYMVLAYSAPESISEKVRGYDIGFEANRRQAAIEARETGQLALSLPISLIPTDSHSLDYLMLQPVYDRVRKTFRGWTTLGFSMSDMADQAVSVAGKGLHLRLYDERKQDGAVYLSQSPAFDRSEMQYHSFLYIGSLGLPLQILPAKGGPYAIELQAYDRDALRLMIVLSALISLVVYLLLNSRFTAVRMANRLLDRFAESESRYRSLFELSPEAIIIHRKGHILLANQSAQRLLGASSQAVLIDRLILDYVSESSKSDVSERMARLLEEGSNSFVEEKLKRFDGSEFLAEISGNYIQFEGELAVQVMFRDISSEQEMRYESQISKAVFRYTNEPIMVTDTSGIITLVNPAFTQVTGYLPEDVQGEKVSILSSGYHDASFYQAMWRVLSKEGDWEGEITNRKKNGEIYIQRTHISAIHDISESVTQYICVMSDITEQKQELEAIRYQALHDPLTRLPNRSCFIAEAEASLERAHERNIGLAVLFIDLDGFKPVNDTYGHLAGDKLLITIAERLSAHVSGNDIVARVGGDEFLVLLTDFDRLEQVAAFAAQLSKAVSEPVMIDDISLCVGASIGYALYPAQGSSISSLIALSDKNMYQVKYERKSRRSDRSPLADMPDSETA